MSRCVRGWRVGLIVAALVTVPAITPATAPAAGAAPIALESDQRADPVVPAAAPAAVAAAGAATPVLEPAWVVADGRSNRADFDGVPVGVTDEAILTSTGRLYHGPDFAQVHTIPEFVDASIFGSRVSWESWNDPAGVVSERVDGSDRQVYPTEDTVAALIPGGWLEVGWRGDDLALDRVLAADGTVSSRTQIAVILHSEDPVKGGIESVSSLSSDAAAAFSVYSSGQDERTSVRYRFDSGAVDVLTTSGELIDGAPVSWDVGDLNLDEVLLVGSVAERDGLVVRALKSDGTTTWTDAGYPHFVGRDVVWRVGDDHRRGNPDGSVTDLGPEVWFTWGSTLSVGDLLYAADFRDGLVRTGAAGADRVVITPAADRLPLQVGALALSARTLAWTDDSALPDGMGERSGAWRAAVGPDGPEPRESVDPDVRGSALAQQDGATYVTDRGYPPVVVEVAADGTTTPLLAADEDPFLSWPHQVWAAPSEVLVRHGAYTGSLVDLDTGAVTPSTAQTINDRWRVRVDRAPTEAFEHTLIATSVETGVDRVVTTGNPKDFTTALLGDVLVWTEQPTWLNAPEDAQTLHWVDLSADDAIHGSVPLAGMPTVEPSAAGDGWFVLTSTYRTIETPPLLYQVGVPTPRAVLADGFGPAVVDDNLVAWVQTGPDGDRLVAAPLPEAVDVPAVEGMFRPVGPVQIADSVLGWGIPAPLGPGGSAALKVLGVGLMPSTGVAAVALSVTVSEPTGGGHLTVFPGDSDRPEVSQLNFGGGGSVSNLVTVRVGPDGTVVLANDSSRSVQVTVDLVGYYNAGAGAEPGAFVPVDAARIVDSRVARGVAGPIGGNASTRVRVAGTAGIPDSGVAAVVATVTATEPTAAGHLTVFPSGSPRPTVSNVNFVAGESVSNQVTVPVGADGYLLVANDSPGATHLIVDVAGYYLGGIPSASGAFVPVDPSRVLDTRFDAAGPIAAESSRAVPAFGATGPIVGNVTVTQPDAAGAVAVGSVTETLWQLPLPVVRFRAGQTVAVQMIGRTDPDGSLLVWNTGIGTAHVVVDAAGYFLP